MADERRRWFLRERRNKLDLSQEELAARAGVTQGMISQWETGVSDYTGENLQQLAAANILTQAKP